MQTQDKYVYHGSEEKIERAIPKKHTRIDKEKSIIFDDISFHATPIKWIAVAYTYNTKNTYEIDGKEYYYNIGVSLYKNEKAITIYGFKSLEESLEKLYETGGYVATFDKTKFFHTKGLGDLEVITQEEIEPIKIEKIENPVQELKKYGITLNFIDLAKPENAKFRNYKN